MTSEAMAALLEHARAFPTPDEERIEERRAATEAMLLGPLAEGTVAEEAPIGGRPAVWIRPGGIADPDGRTVLYLHGGAFEVGSARAYQAFCSRLAPILLQAAANEVLADDSSVLAQRISSAGGDVTLELCPEAFHVWPMAGVAIPEPAQALETLAGFVRDRWR